MIDARRLPGLTVLTAALLIILSAVSASAETGIALEPGAIVKIKSTTCGYVNKKWVPGSKLKDGTFLTLAKKISGLNKQLKARGLKAAKKKKLKKQIAGLKAGQKAKNKRCKGLQGTGPVPTPTPIATPATPLPDAVTLAWTVSAFAQSGNLGGEYLFFCPPNTTETLRAVYGHDSYTTDSAICVAGLHLGLFSRSSGGNVKIRITAGQSYYPGSIRNNVQSNFFGSYASSYVFLDLGTGAEINTHTIPQISWSQTAQPLYTMVEGTFSFYCPSGVGLTRSIWGTDRYTYDSSICTAGVHAGRISVSTGGFVTIQIKPDAGSYQATTRHGISSSSYGSWGGSYVFVP